jgi:LPS O-antigen subunit length determinant protein (WzzB/FepE family)
MVGIAIVFIIVAFLVALIVGQKWKKDSVREEKDNERFFDFEDEWLKIHRD